MWQTFRTLLRRLDWRLTKGVYQHGHDWSKEKWTDEMTRERREASEARHAGIKPGKDADDQEH